MKRTSRFASCEYRFVRRSPGRLADISFRAQLPLLGALLKLAQLDRTAYWAASPASGACRVRLLTRSDAY